MIPSLAMLLLLVSATPPPKAKPHAFVLVPMPQRVVHNKGAFRIGASTNIVFSDQLPEDRFAAEQLMEEILTDLGERIEPISKPSPKAITLTRLTAPVSKSDLGQGYKLDVTPLKITISAQTAEGMFYGVQTLKQLIRANRKLHSIPACHIVDWPTLKYRGWQHDISRGPIPTYAFLMKEIRTLSEFKLNMLTLYTEHVFKLKKHPTIAPEDGITADEIVELCSYAKQFHVEVVGNFQSFGHFENILKTPGYQNLAENRRVLSPAKDESYRFLSEVFSEVAPAYTSPLFNINCDEVSGLGEGPSARLVRQIGVANVYANHINRVVALLRKYGKTPMMWGDIALKFPEIVPKLPKDLIALPWAYDPRASFENQILPFTKSGLQFMVCPGVSCWNQMWPDLDTASVNISNFIRDGAKMGAIGVLNTTWFDDGVSFFDDNWYELVWGADCSWVPATPTRAQDPELVRKVRMARFDREFPSVFYGIPGSKLSTAMKQLSTLRKNPVSGGLKNSAFWRDPTPALATITDPESITAYLGDVAKVTEQLLAAKPKATHNAATLDYALFAARRAKFLGDSLLAVRAQQQFNMQPVRNLAAELAAIKDSYADLWQRENRLWWLDKNIAKFEDLQTTIRKLYK